MFKLKHQKILTLKEHPITNFFVPYKNYAPRSWFVHFKIGRAASFHGNNTLNDTF